MDKVEERLAEDVVDARLFSAEMRAIERRLGDLESAQKEHTRNQTTMYRSIVLMGIGVLVEAVVILLKLAG